ncbi:MAG TPA: ATP-binding protein [Verrucomicrobiae bacterium]|nr:ATP-binding protein [Verrucomicrobiae bacterium]
MNRQTRSRFAELVLAVVLVIIVLVWAERWAWNQIATLRNEVNVEQVDRAEATQYLARANAGLTRLQRLLFWALLCLLISGVVLVLLAYGRMIAPLRNTLTQSRAAIERQEKLASLGVFVTGIAHEIRNPLTAIKVRLFSLKQSHRAGTSENEDLQVIGAEIDRLERIVKDFLQFARPAEPDLKMVPATALLNNIRELLSSELAKRSVELKIETSPDHFMKVDSNRIKQVLLNLVQNAAESMPKGETVTLSTRTGRRVLLGRPTQVVMIDVTDTGTGMSADIRKRLFDPFFTTKEYGTGLGLPISARIVERHDGVREYKTQPIRGTTFTIVLPKPTIDETTLENPAG